MSHSRLSLILSALWLAAAGTSGLLFLLVEPMTALLATGGLVLALGAGGVVIGPWLDARSQRRVRALADSAGITVRGKTVHVETVVASLADQLERAAAAKAGFSALQRAALVATAGGDILVSTQGLRQLQPSADEGKTLDVLLGDGFMAAGGGLAEHDTVALGGKRFDATTRPIGSNRILVELTAMGHLVADDDLDTFVSAIAGGHTGIRFEVRDMERSPVIKAFGMVLATFDRASTTISGLLKGEVPDPDDLGEAGLDPLLRELCEEMQALSGMVGDQSEQRTALERRLGTIIGVIDNYRTVTSMFTRLAGVAHNEATEAGKALSNGRLRIKEAAHIGTKARELVSGAGEAARRTHSAAEGVNTAAGEIDRLMAAIEDISSRTNTLALNAAVEAGRAGENGAGFAAVAEEVRGLAQQTADSTKEVRELIGRSRAQAGVGISEAETLGELIEGLEGHLRSITEQAGVISETLESGGGALARLDAGLGAAGKQAERVLAADQHQPRAAADADAHEPMRAAGGRR